MFFGRRKKVKDIDYGKPEGIDYKTLVDNLVAELGKRCHTNYSVDTIRHHGLIGGQERTSFSIYLVRRHNADGNGLALGTKYGIYNGYPCKTENDAYQSLIKDFLSKDNELNVHSVNELQMKLLLIGLQ